MRVYKKRILKKIKILSSLLIGNLEIMQKPDSHEIFALYTADFRNYGYIKQIRKEFKEIEKEEVCLENQVVNCKLFFKPRKHFTILYKEFYNEKGKKIIPKTIDNYMSGDFLCMLFFEIGKFEANPDNISLDVTKYDTESLENLRMSLYACFEIQTRILRDNEKTLLKITDKLSLIKFLIPLQYGKFNLFGENNNFNAILKQKVIKVNIFEEKNRLNRFVGLLVSNNLKIKKPKGVQPTIAIYKKNLWQDTKALLDFDKVLQDCVFLCNYNQNLEIILSKKRKITTIIGRFLTLKYTQLTLLYKEFYNEKGKKIIPKTIDNYMSEDFICMLYEVVGKNVKENNKIMKYIYNMSKYDIESIENLQISMKEKLGIESVIIKNKKRREIHIIEEDSITLLSDFRIMLSVNRSREMIKEKV